MKRIVSVQFSLFFLLFLCRTSSAGIEELFENIESSTPQDGLALEIVLPKETYFYGEPVTFYGRFRNTTDGTIAVVLEETDKSEIGTRWWWESSPLDGKKHRTDPYGSTLQNMFFIPGQGTVHIAFPDKVFPVGRTKVALKYSYKQTPGRPLLNGVHIWQGEIKSNESVVVVEDKETLTPEELRLVEEKIWRHVEAFSDSEWFEGYRAENHLVTLSKYSVPILKKCLKHKNYLVRVHAVSALGRIANKNLAEQVGFKRDVSSLDDLLLTYNRERHTIIKRKVVVALISFCCGKHEKCLNSDRPL